MPQDQSIEYVLIIEMPEWAELLKDPTLVPMFLEAITVVSNYIWHKGESEYKALAPANLPSFVDAVSYAIPGLVKTYFNLEVRDVDYEAHEQLIFDLLHEMYTELTYTSPGHFLAHDLVNLTRTTAWVKVTACDVDRRLLV